MSKSLGRCTRFRRRTSERSCAFESTSEAFASTGTSHSGVEPGKRSTDTADYPTGKAPYATRTVDGLATQARALGEHVGVYADRLLAGPLPWTKMRQVYALLRLCQRYGSERVDALCARALAFDVVSVPRIERMLK